MLYDSTAPRNESWNYNEKEARDTFVRVAQGHTLIDHLFEK
jgi:2,3-bisphosphoglycerate-independent phosphoglycerate mutase